MLVVKKVEGRSHDQGDYYVELNSWIEVNDPHINRFGYYCDKAHLRHMYLELKKIFEDEQIPKITIEGIKVEKVLNFMLPGYCSMTFPNESAILPIYQGNNSGKGIYLALGSGINKDEKIGYVFFKGNGRDALRKLFRCTSFDTLSCAPYYFPCSADQEILYEALMKKG